MAFSGYKNQRRRTGKVGGRREGKKMVVPLFLLKETEEATERDHEQWRKKAASPPSRFCFFCCQRGVNTGNQQDAKTGELGGESEPPGERERERERSKRNKPEKTQETEQTEGKQIDREEKNKNVLTGGLGKRKTQETESVSTISSPSSATLRPLGIQTGEEPPSLLFRPPSSSTIVLIFL
jgi:hypothetical protein